MLFFVSFFFFLGFRCLNSFPVNWIFNNRLFIIIFQQFKSRSRFHICKCRPRKPYFRTFSIRNSMKWKNLMPIINVQCIFTSNFSKLLKKFSKSFSTYEFFFLLLFIDPLITKWNLNGSICMHETFHIFINWTNREKMELFTHATKCVTLFFYAIHNPCRTPYRFNVGHFDQLNESMLNTNMYAVCCMQENNSFRDIVNTQYTGFFHSVVLTECGPIRDD